MKQLSAEDFEEFWPLLRDFLDNGEDGFETCILVSQSTRGDYKFPHGTKASHVAALYGLELMLDHLLRLDPACRTQQTSDGRTPLHIALENQQDRAVDLLLHSHVKNDLILKTSLMIKDNRGRTPLHVAIESGRDAAVV